MPSRPGDPRNTTAWQRTRHAVRERDNHTCQHCGNHRRLSAHHIHPTNNPNHPAFWDMTNLITLCPRCHHRADLKAGAAGTGGRGKGKKIPSPGGRQARGTVSHGFVKTPNEFLDTVVR